MIQIEWWSRSSDDPYWVMIQIQWWWSSSDDPDQVMIQIQWWWSRSSDVDPDPWWCPMMIQIERWSRFKEWRLLEDSEDSRCRWWDDPVDIEKKTSAENCVERIPSYLRGSFDVYVTLECISYIYCNPMSILGCTWVMSCPDVPIGNIYNVNKSCQVILGNPPIV